MGGQSSLWRNYTACLKGKNELAKSGNGMCEGAGAGKHESSWCQQSTMRRDAPLTPIYRVDWNRGQGDQSADHCINPGAKKNESSLNY